MTQLTREEQKLVTSNHLKGDMEIEGWLIPFAITLSLMIIVVIVMVTVHLLSAHRRKKEGRANNKDYQPANMDSDEAVALSSTMTELSTKSRHKSNGVAGNNRTDDEHNGSEYEHELAIAPNTTAQNDPWASLPHSNI